MQRRVFIGALLFTTAGCATTTDPIIVTAAWSGTLTLTIAGSPTSVPLTMTLLQYGPGVTGTFTYTATSRAATVSGMMEDRRLEISVTPNSISTDNCAQFSLELVFNVSNSVLTATGGSGTYCHSSSAGQIGPHPVTAASGTLTRN